MAAKKQRVSRKSRSRNQNVRKGSSRIRRFFRAAGISAIVSFSIVSWALHSPWQDQVSVESLTDWVSLERLGLEGFDLGLERFTRYDHGTVPTAAAVDGAVQTTFAQCPQFFPDQPPIVPAHETLRELCFSSFAILHNGGTKTPVFVAQRLNRQMLSRTASVQRTDRFYAEGRLPRSERSELEDYRGSGYSRGHMAPAGDMHDDEAMAQSFSLANMVPQHQRHNAGVWSRIENDTRKYVMRASGDVYVMTGPVYATRSETIGAGRVAVPDYLYKVVYDATTGGAWVHWHRHSDETRADRPISYGEFVRRTGLHLLPGAAAG